MLLLRSISLFLIGLLLTIMVQPSVKIISFYQNQAEIIAEHCVNKEKPELKCEGPCYLDQQLKQSKQQPENNAIPEVSVFIPIAIDCHFVIELHTPTYVQAANHFGNVDHNEIAYYGEVFTPPKIIA